MLFLYAIGLGMGGTLLLASLIMGAHGNSADSPDDDAALGATFDGAPSTDADGDSEGAGDGEADGDAEEIDEAEHGAFANHDHPIAPHGAISVHHSGSHAHTEKSSVTADASLVTALLPIVSLRFWTFFTAFFGLTGLILTLLGLGTQNSTIDALIACAVGYASGTSVLAIGRRLKGRQADSNVGIEDCVGSTATVLLTVAKNRTGKIRFDIKGRLVELLAETEDDAPIQAKQEVLIYRITADGRAMVTQTTELAMTGRNMP